MAKKTISPDERCPEDNTLLESDVQAKLEASLYQLTRAQCIQVLQTQRDHDAALAEAEKVEADKAEKTKAKK